MSGLDFTGKVVAVAVDQPFQVHAGGDAHLLAHEDEVLGADVSCGTLVCGEGAAAETGARRVELRDAELQGRRGVGEPGAARVVQMQRQRKIGPRPAPR
jgi:hypothetical protein